MLRAIANRKDLASAKVETASSADDRPFAVEIQEVAAAHVEIEAALAGAHAPPEPPKRRGRKVTPWVAERMNQKSSDQVLREMVADPAKHEVLIKQLEALRDIQSFPDFCRNAWHVIEPSTKLQWNWHHQLLACLLQGLFESWLDCKNGKDPLAVPAIRNCLINTPPGSLKSKIISVLFAAWVWLRAPGTKLICISVNDLSAQRDARTTRDLIESNWFKERYRPNWSLKVDQDAVSNFGNTSGGERLSKPSGSTIVGLRGDLLIGDDLNDPLAAEEEKEREKVNRLWSTNQYNRVNDPLRSLRICVQQRTHGDDHSGYALRTQGTWSSTNLNGWLHVVLSAEFDPTRKFVMPEPLAKVLRAKHLPEKILQLEDPRTKIGESIDATRMPSDFLADERKRWEGTSNYSGQMLQSPALAEGSRIKREYWGWFRLEGGVRDDIDALETGRPRPEHCIKRRVLDDGTVMGEAEVIRAKHHSPGEWDFDWVELHLDPAVKKTERGSKWGAVVMAGKGARRYVLDNRSQRGDILEIVEVLRSTIRMWRPSKICIEDKAAGEELRKRLLDEMNKGDMPMVTLELIKIKGNQGKDERLDACIAVLANGMVSLLDGAPWLEEFVKELAGFPFYQTDDAVDCVTQCLNHHMEFEDESWPSF